MMSSYKLNICSFLPLFNYYQLYLMLITLLKRCVMFNSKISAQIYHEMGKKFALKPQISAFGQYFHRENLVEIFNIIRDTKIDSKQKIQHYRNVQSLCSGKQEMDFNILANICRQKALLYFSLRNQAYAVNQIQKAISSLLCMENPHQFQLVMLYLTSSNIMIECGQYGKGEKALLEAENLILILQDEMDPNDEQNLKGINFMLAKIYTNYCFLKLKTKKGEQAKRFMGKAMEEWEKVSNKNNSSYETTIKYKCLLHSQLKENSEAIQTAEDYLAHFEQTDLNAFNRLWFMKFLSHYDEKHKENLKEKLQRMKKSLPPKVFEDILKRLGFLQKGDKSK